MRGGPQGLHQPYVSIRQHTSADADVVPLCGDPQGLACRLKDPPCLNASGESLESLVAPPARCARAFCRTYCSVHPVTESARHPPPTQPALAEEGSRRLREEPAQHTSAYLSIPQRIPEEGSGRRLREESALAAVKCRLVLKVCVCVCVCVCVLLV
jgi:hypothetical protein